jgi:hypothetical protein
MPLFFLNMWILIKYLTDISVNYLFIVILTYFWTNFLASCIDILEVFRTKFPGAYKVSGKIKLGSVDLQSIGCTAIWRSE